MSYQQKNYGNVCDSNANQDGIVEIEHDDGSSAENHQRGNEDERNRGSNGHSTIVGGIKMSNRWTRCKRKLRRNSTRPTVSVEIWNLINKTLLNEARIHILYCSRPWCLRFVPFVKKNRLVGCNISNILPSNGSEVSRETQRHTTRAPSDTRLAPVDFNLDTIVVALRVLALDSHIQIEHWDKIRKLCVTIEQEKRDLPLPPQAIIRLSQLSLFANTLMISPSTLDPGLEGFGNFTFSETGDQCASNLKFARTLKQQVATQTTIRHVVVASVKQHDVKWYRHLTV